MSYLTVKNMTVFLNQNKILDNFSFKLKKGEIGCLLGESGCGKTTFIRAIAGFEKITKGSIEINGNIIASSDYSLPVNKRNIGVVFQEGALFGHLTVEKNILFGIRQLSKEEQVSRLKDLLELVSLSGYEKRYPHELSGGQQQRVALARALAPRPDILLLDEPFSSLDDGIRKKLCVDVKKIIKETNMTALMVTHNKEEATAFGDCVILTPHHNLV
jgi:iron(III) transport system ATP-binding protein